LVARRRRSARSRGKLVTQLLGSLELDGGDELTDAEWAAACAAEIDRRARELEEGRAELINGDQAHAKIQAMLAARRGGGKR
jgi:hypothetical protein